MKFLATFVLIFCSIEIVLGDQKPNVVIIMADDLGWNDVSFHGSDEILTPNIDALAYSGVIMNKFYAAQLCTPSRSSLLTGKYTNRIGMQHFVILNDTPFGLSPKEKIMPQYFKDAGYNTHLIGKWHQGFHQKQYTPTMRGFDSFFGYYGGYIDYYSYTCYMLDRNYSRGYDMRKNLSPNYEIPTGVYATDLFTDEAVKTITDYDYKKPLFLLLNHLAAHAGNEDDPMQAPQSEIDKFKHIPDLKRRTLAAMISKLDTGVGSVMKALKKRGVLKNTIVLFYSDNGGPTIGIHSTAASNFPLRGQKASGWEGSLRTVAFMYSPLLHRKGYISNDMFHITDILPTLARVAGFKITDKIDGIDQWDTINKRQPTKRTETLLVSDTDFAFSAIINKNYKIVNGTINNGAFDGWLGNTNNTNYHVKDYLRKVLESDSFNAIRDYESKKFWNIATILARRKDLSIRCGGIKKTCNPLKGPCLFDIDKDPCEENNLAESKPDILNNMVALVKSYAAQTVKSRLAPSDPKSDPVNFNMTWNWWQPDALESCS